MPALPSDPDFWHCRHRGARSFRLSAIAVLTCVAVAALAGSRDAGVECTAQRDGSGDSKRKGTGGSARAPSDAPGQARPQRRRCALSNTLLTNARLPAKLPVRTLYCAETAWDGRAPACTTFRLCLIYLEEKSVNGRICQHHKADLFLDVLSSFLVSPAIREAVLLLQATHSGQAALGQWSRRNRRDRCRPRLTFGASRREPQSDQRPLVCRRWATCRHVGDRVYANAGPAGTELGQRADLREVGTAFAAEQNAQQGSSAPGLTHIQRSLPPSQLRYVFTNCGKRQRQQFVATCRCWCIRDTMRRRCHRSPAASKRE